MYMYNKQTLKIHITTGWILHHIRQQSEIKVSNFNFFMLLLTYQPLCSQCHSSLK